MNLMTQINVVTAFNENSLKDHQTQMIKRVDTDEHPDSTLIAYYFYRDSTGAEYPECIDDHKRIGGQGSKE